MPKRPPQDPIASDLAIRERVVLFGVASRTDWQRAGVPEEVVARMTVRGLVARDALGRHALTGRGRAVLRALLPEL